MALRRRIGTMHAESVEDAGLEPGDVAVPYEVRHFRKIEAIDFERGLGGVEKADLDPRGDPRVDGEVDAGAVVRRSAREGLSGMKQTVGHGRTSSMATGRWAKARGSAIESPSLPVK